MSQRFINVINVKLSNWHKKIECKSTTTFKQVMVEPQTVFPYTNLLVYTCGFKVF